MSILITGVAGQDGGYLAQQLVAAGEEVTGLLHPREQVPEHLVALQTHGRLRLLPCDVGEPGSLRAALKELVPDRIFHFAAISEPQRCEQEPEASRRINVTSCQVLAEWVRREHPAGRLLLLSSAAVFGDQAEAPQSEATRRDPQSEYGRQKLEVLELAAAARQEGSFVACAIPFNHESERREETFVFAKVCNSVARIALGQQQQLRLGAASPRRDWGYAPEFVRAMGWMLEIDDPLDIVLGTGESHSVGELAEAACALAGIDSEQSVIFDSSLMQQHPVGIADSRANASLAYRELGWEAETRFAELVKKLTLAALARYRPA